VKLRAILVVSVALAVVGSAAIAAAGGARASTLMYPDGVSGQPKPQIVDTTVRKKTTKPTSMKKNYVDCSRSDDNGC
jgi:hypothetical protein